MNSTESKTESEVHEHIAKLIAGIRGGKIAEVWDEFKKGRPLNRDDNPDEPTDATQAS